MQHNTIQTDTDKTYSARKSNINDDLMFKLTKLLANLRLI
jgi:hypothetical protein